MLPYCHHERSHTLGLHVDTQARAHTHMHSPSCQQNTNSRIKFMSNLLRVLYTIVPPMSFISKSRSVSSAVVRKYKVCLQGMKNINTLTARVGLVAAVLLLSKNKPTYHRWKVVYMYNTVPASSSNSRLQENNCQPWVLCQRNDRCHASLNSARHPSPSFSRGISALDIYIYLWFLWMSMDRRTDYEDNKY